MYCRSAVSGTSRNDSVSERIETDLTFDFDPHEQQATNAIDIIPNARANLMAKTPGVKKTVEPPPPNSNDCDDQNGIRICEGGQPSVVPFPTTGGPYAVVVTINPTSGLPEIEFADLSTLCPGTTMQKSQPVERKPCECGPPDCAGVGPGV